jgi:protein-tyrosine phosphatase
MESCLAKSWDIPINKLASTGWTIESAGTFATTGLPATDYSIQVARDLELDLSGHRAQSLSEALEKPWDIILGLTHAHLSDLPEIQGVQLDVLDPTGADISDPYGGSLATYQKMRDEVVNGVQNRVKRWSEWPPT